MIDLSNAKNGDVYVDTKSAEWFYIGKDDTSSHVLSNAGWRETFNNEGVGILGKLKLTHKKPTPRTFEVFVHEDNNGMTFATTRNHYHGSEKLIARATITEGQGL
jgi:hypothetical protein